MTSKTMMKTMEFDWQQDGINNERPKWKLVFGDYAARVVYGYGNDGWSAVVNNSGKLYIETDDDAKRYIEDRIRHDIATRLKTAHETLSLYAEYASQGTRASFDAYYREKYGTLSLGEAFCRYFNEDDSALRSEKDDTVAQQKVDAYFEAWGVK